jgi:predicted aldo/keto reductase-like oxidoreductase
MELRKLGRTDIEVGTLGLGTEYFHGVERETVVSIVREAVEAGVSYFDLLWPYPEYLDDLGVALQGLRERVTLAVHVGCVDDQGQPRRSRDIPECTAAFEERLRRLGLDHADIAMVHHVDEEEDYRGVAGPGGLLELAQRLQQEGKARFIAIGSHRVPIARAAVAEGRFDALMFPVNPAFDAVAGEAGLDSAWAAFGEAGRAASEHRRRLYEQCAAKNVGLIAMKPYAAGRFFEAARPQGEALSPVQLLSYAVSQPGVSTVIPGVKSLEELRAALALLTATEEEKGFGPALARSSWVPEGSCVYCNHCLPCPSGIDIGRTLRLAGAAGQGFTAELRAEAAALPASPSECVECGECVERCPFGVAVMEEMRQASEVLAG